MYNYYYFLKQGLWCGLKIEKNGVTKFSFIYCYKVCLVSAPICNNDLHDLILLEHTSN